MSYQWEISLLRDEWKLSWPPALTPTARTAPISNVIHHSHRDTQVSQCALPCGSSENRVTVPVHGPQTDPKKTITQFSWPRLLPQTCKNYIYREENAADHLLVRGQASLSVFVHCITFTTGLFTETQQGEGRAWNTTSCFGISIPGFWIPASTISCWFRVSQERRLLFGNVKFSLHFKLSMHRYWARIVPCASYKAQKMRQLSPPLQELILWSGDKIFINPSQLGWPDIPF